MINVSVGNKTQNKIDANVHFGPYIHFGRTVSRNYQSAQVQIGFHLPQGLSVPDGFFLAKMIVNVQIESSLPKKDLKKANTLCQQVFGCSLSDFTGVQCGLKELPRRSRITDLCDATERDLY